MVTVPAIVASNQTLCSLRPVTAKIVQVEWEQSVRLVGQSRVDISSGFSV